MEKLITKAEVCKLLNVSLRTLERIVGDGKLPFYKVRGAYRFRESDIDAYIRGCRQQYMPPVEYARLVKEAAAERAELEKVPDHYYPGMRVV